MDRVNGTDGNAASDDEPLRGDFGFRIHADGDAPLVRAWGEVDMATAPLLGRAIARWSSGTLRVDLSEVTFLDSSGLRVLLLAHRDAQRAGGRVIVCGPLIPAVRRTITLSGIDEVIELSDDR